MVHDEPRPHLTLRGRLATLRARIRATPAGRILLATVIAILGGAVVAVGLLLVPLPGPGWLIVVGGIAIWSLEFRWARRLLVRVRGMLHVWTGWVRRQSLVVRAAISGLILLAVGAAGWLALRQWFGIDLADRLWG